VSRFEPTISCTTAPPGYADEIHVIMSYRLSIILSSVFVRYVVGCAMFGFCFVLKGVVLRCFVVKAVVSADVQMSISSRSTKLLAVMHVGLLSGVVHSTSPTSQQSLID